MELTATLGLVEKIVDKSAAACRMPSYLASGHSSGGVVASQCGLHSIIQVRAVQRRLGMLASASDLSEGFKDELRGIRKALEQQRACNVVVDEVVQVEVWLFAR